MERDSRFAKVARDPRFKKVPRKHRKVKIDARFQKMFTDKRFTTKYFVDKRGSKLGTTSSEDLHKYYELSDDNEANNELSKQSNEEVGEIERTEKEGKTRKDPKSKIRKEKKKGADYARGEGATESSSDDEVTQVDYARGEGVVESSSDDDFIAAGDHARGEGVTESSDNDEEDDDEEDDDEEEEGIELPPLNTIQTEVEHNWGELDSNALTTEKATKRLAVCNLDWDRVTASDILVLFNSVKPAGAVIHSVKIYPSEFGLERMKKEDVCGPEELQDCDELNDDGKEEGDAFSQEKLRQYQINRLKYYYAVVDCDSCKTANHLYEECDGVEFELSANILDLRFIPEDMEFEHEPKSVCVDLPAMTAYEPMNFMTTALNQSNVKVTWDETEPGRLRATMRKFDKKDILDMDFKAYLASSTDEDSDNSGEEIVRNQHHDSVNTDDDSGDDDKRIEKYKQLLREINKKDEADQNENEMAITWEPGLQENAQQLVSRKMKEKHEEKLTPWEKYQKERKQKRKERREKQRNYKDNDREFSGKEASEVCFSDDDIPSDVDVSDPFFSQESSSGFAEFQKAEKNKQNAQKRKGKRTKELSEEDKKKQDELKLLMMDEEDNKKHFSLKKILENEENSKKKKKRKDDYVTEDTFQVNVKDPRFDALYTSHHFALDPSDPQFRKTKAVENILEEKQKRRKMAKENTVDRNIEQKLAEKKKEKQIKDPSLSLLVKSIKSKTGQYNEQKKKRKPLLS